MALYGYTRVSVFESVAPEDDRQRLMTEGCERVFHDIASSTSSHRPEWAECLGALREGDRLMITRLDRIGRSLGHLHQITNSLRSLGVVLDVLDQRISSDFFLDVVALHEFEKNLAAMSAREAPPGKAGGRPPVLTHTALSKAQSLYDTGSLTVEQVSRVIGVSASTLYRYLVLHGRDSAQMTLNVQ